MIVTFSVWGFAWLVQLLNWCPELPQGCVLFTAQGFPWSCEHLDLSHTLSCSYHVLVTCVILLKSVIRIKYFFCVFSISIKNYVSKVHQCWLELYFISCHYWIILYRVKIYIYVYIYIYTHTHIYSHYTITNIDVSICFCYFKHSWYSMYNVSQHNFFMSTL